MAENHLRKLLTYNKTFCQEEKTKTTEDYWAVNMKKHSKLMKKFWEVKKNDKSLLCSIQVKSVVLGNNSKITV